MQPVVETLRDYFEENGQGDEFDAVVLFGSHANGGAREYSDVDLGFLFRAEPDYMRLGYHVALLEVLLKRRVDAVTLNDLEKRDPLLAYEISQNHQIVHLKNEEHYVAFKTRSILYYLDTLPLIKRNRENLRRRIRENQIGARCYVGTH